jgi:phospholipid/cholesterol/gamma-HCH transport system substrate-binding protein
MKPFVERNLVAVGAVGVALTGATVLAVLNVNHLPFLNSVEKYSAYFAEAGGLTSGAAVQVSGYQVGSVTDVALDGARVVVTFTIDDDVHLGKETEAAIKTKSLLGAKILDVSPRGDGSLSGPIPLERTTSPYQLGDTLGDLATTINEIDTKQLSESLATLSQTFSSTPPQLQIAVSSLSRFSQSLDARDKQLRNLLENANKATKVLANRSDQVVALISDSNELLAQLRTESSALDTIAGNITALSNQLSGFVSDNRAQLKPALDKLNGVLTTVANRKERVQDSIHRLNSFAMSLGESVSSGPFFNAYVANLLPGQFLQPFIDAAFSDLGVDPNVKLPSELVDPQVGQPGTPALPVPYPRTGQGGEPRLTLPDAITGNPGDERYPYREPPPAPPPGGPPPGPPATDGDVPGAEPPAPTPSPVNQSDPVQVPPATEGSP